MDKFRCVNEFASSLPIQNFTRARTGEVVGARVKLVSVPDKM